MAKKINSYIKLQVPAGKANPSPPVGPALGQHGLNIMAFCKDFNSRTKSELGMIIPVIITVYDDKSFSFITKTPPVSILLKEAAGLKMGKKPGSGSKTPGKEKVASLNRFQLEKIAKIKMPDLNSYDIDSAVKIISGTARSMGIDII